MKLEDKYFVFKKSDVRDSTVWEYFSRATSRINESRAAHGKQYLECLVIERDWPEYEPTLKLLSDRVDSESQGLPFNHLTPEPVKPKALTPKVLAGKHSHYFKDVRNLNQIDVYRVCELFNVEDPSGATQHAIKKLLLPGGRGNKGVEKDLREAMDSIERRLEMLRELEQ